MVISFVEMGTLHLLFCGMRHLCLSAWIDKDEVYLFVCLYVCLIFCLPVCLLG